MDAVHSGIVVYGGGDIVFGAKRSNQWTQLDAVCSGIVLYGGGDIVLWCKKVKPEDAVCRGHSGIVIYGGGDIVKPVDAVDAVTQWTMSPPPYTMASTAYCILRPLV